MERVLVVGGSGMIGSHIARHLSTLGSEVAIGSRHGGDDGPFPVVVGDYVDRSFTADQLGGFDAVVFAAGQDVRHTGGAAPDAEFWRKTQSEGVPAFAALARAAGVRLFVQIGSYYHHLVPDLAERDAYVHARMVADRDARRLASADFAVMTINPPSVVGAIPGASLARFRGLAAWARGERPEVPDFAPSGATNYMSATALAEAVAGALRDGEGGKAYLVGGENLSYRDFFQMIFDAAGSNRTLEARDAPHPMLPDAYIVHGRGVTLAYEPDEGERQLLGYRRGDIAATLRSIVAQVDA